MHNYNHIIDSSSLAKDWMSSLTHHILQMMTLLIDIIEQDQSEMYVICCGNGRF
jgi:hypothetical protein